jgi:solute carrier family 25 carnitine/acylcarnitine transporter 20/29
VERIKVMMQASEKSFYENELHCAEAVISAEGWEGLLVRGLGTTIAREVPSYAVYFVLYGFLMQTPIAIFLGGFAPLIFGALSGCASWLPVYPVDVVKTLIQNTEGKEGHVNVWDVIHELYSEGGIAAFFDGLKPKMLRAAVSHAVTFWTYSIVMEHFIQ